jgi:aminocarboxymuconate-semialdehyde decarboxylase
MPPLAFAAAEVIDVHTHFMPTGLPDFAEQTGDSRWPRLVPGSGLTGDVMCGADRFRRVSRSCWDLDARIEAMNDLGVAAQVVSPVPVSLTYWAERALGVEFIRIQNDLIAEALSGAGERTIGLAGVPLQDVDSAIDELHRATAELGMAGIEIGTVVGGEELDAPRLRPFFEEATRLGVPVFVHPVDGAGATRCSTPVAAFGIGMLADTAVAAHALIYGGVLADLPGLRVCLSHGGGAYPVAHHRLRYLSGVLAGVERESRSEELDELARLLWADALVFDPTHLPVAAAVFSPEHLMVGSDFPFVEYSAATAAALGVGGTGVRADNARHFLFGEPVAGHQSTAATKAAM